jgi:two-component system response regulator AlgR
MAPPGAIRALVVDDEMLAVRRLVRSLERVAGIEILASTTSAREALDLIGSVAPDLVFVDIAMPGLTGFELVERIEPAKRPAIIFVTAYDAYAVQAFDVAAVDYLLKPVAQPRLQEAVERARLWLQARSAPGASEPAGERPIDSLWIQRHRELVRMPVEEVEWIEADGDYARIHGRRFSGLARTTLTAMAGRLDPRLFMRVHRSAICRKAAIVSLRRAATGAVSVLLANGDEAPVGRTFIPGLRALLREVER